MKWIASIASLVFYTAAAYIPATSVITLMGNNPFPLWIAILAWLMSVIAKEGGEQ